MLLKTTFLSLLSVAVLGAPVMAMGDMESLLEGAVLASRKVRAIHEEGLRRRTLESKQLGNLLEFITEHPEKDATLRPIVLARLQEDALVFDSLNKALPQCRGVREQAKSNKMHLGVEKAIALHKDSFYDICDGRLPEGYSIEVPNANVFPNEDHIYSTGRGRALKHLLTTAALALLKAHDIDELRRIIGCDVGTSPFVHYTPLPEGFDVSGYAASPYFKIPGKFAVIHNGYAFGGQRFERPEQDGPHDCSTFVAEHYELDPMTITTEQYAAHQLGQCRYHFDSLGGDVVQTWEKKTKPKFLDSKAVHSILARMTALDVSDPDALRPGWVSVERRFTGYRDNYSLVQEGTSGHTSVVLGTIGHGPDMKLWTIGADRNIDSPADNRDFSYGIEARPMFGDPLQDPTAPLVMYFRSKDEGGIVPGL